MAIINNNVENVKFLRNQNPFESREAARTALESNKGQAADGTALLARYTITDGQTTDVKTLVGFVAEVNSTKYVTIFDVEGGSEDVNNLREEINAKLGTTFISSSNTVESNLTALSGNNSSTSAETSVEGAKRYADELKNQMDYSGVTTGTGVYVTNVTQSDGIVSATTATLPTVTGEVESKKVVMSVSEDKGEIAVTKGTIESSDKTVVIGDLAEGNGVDFKVNIDGETLVADTSTGVISVASAALTQYVGDEDTIHISAADAQNNKTVSSLLTISATTPSEANVKEQYNLVGASGNTIGATIKIYKDSALLSVALLHADTTANPQVLPTYDKATNTWTDIADPTDENQALCYAYEDVSGNTVVAAVPVGAFINEQEFASGVTWDATANKVKGVVDSTSEKDSQDTPVDFLTVGADGFKISGIKDEIDRQLDAVVEDLDATVTGETANQHITISIEELDGKLVQSGLTITESNIANADDLAELSGKTVTALTSTNGSITAQIDDAAGCKTYDIETDADKIKMSGFTSTDALSGITEADSIATAFEKVDAVITENEQVTSEALNDLNSRINTVSGEVETLTTDSLSGITVNGTAVAPSNHVAPLVIDSTSAATESSDGKAITVQTDANGNITLGISSIDCGYYSE
jgi:hypothetical protein